MATAPSILAPQQSQPTTPASIVFSEFQARVFNQTEAAYKTNGYLSTPLFEDSYLLSKATAQYVIEYVPLTGNQASVQNRALEVYRGVLGIEAPTPPPPPPPPVPSLPTSVPPVRSGNNAGTGPVVPNIPVAPIVPSLPQPITTPTTFTPPTANPPTSPPTTPQNAFTNLVNMGSLPGSGFYGGGNPLFGGLNFGSSIFGSGGLFTN